MTELTVRPMGLPALHTDRKRVFRAGSIGFAICSLREIVLRKREFYIDGRWDEPRTARTLSVIDPSTGQPCAIISAGDETDIDRAVHAARRAFADWSCTPPGARLALVEKLLAIYMRRAPEMAKTVSLEMGAPIDLAANDHVGAGAFHIRNFITAFRDFRFERPLGAHAPDDRILMEPIGVAGLITPGTGR